MTGTGLEGIDWRAGLTGDGGIPVVVTIRFREGRVSGSAGCNRYTAACEIGDGTLRLGPIATTMMACEPAVMEVEGQVLERLGRSVGWEVEPAGPSLRLRDEDGLETLVFDGRPMAVTGRRWVATGVNNGRDGVVGIVAGSEIDAVFCEDGRVEGSAGCNRYTGTWSTLGEGVTIGRLATTRRMCPGPAGVMEQEAAYTAAMARAAGFSVEGDRLELRDGDGALQVGFRAAGQA